MEKEKKEEQFYPSGLYLNSYEISQRGTEDLKRILGTFENEYNESAVGEVKHNEILGMVKEGTIAHALKVGAITRKQERIYGKDMDYIHFPEYREYETKIRIIAELRARREYAKNLEKEAQNALTEIY